MLVRAPAPLLGRAVFVRAPPQGGACCVGVCSPPWWGLLRGFVAPLMVGRAVLVLGPPIGGACCVGACPLPWWCLAWVVVVCWGGSSCGCVVCLAGVGAVLVRPPPLFWRVAFVRAPPLLVGRAVSGYAGFVSWCCSRLDARLVSLVHCCLRRRTAGVVGCWLSVVFASPGRTGRPPERVWCTTPLSWPGRTGRSLERVWCATPCFCFSAVVALPLVFPCSLPAFSYLPGSSPCAGVCCRLLLCPPKTPPHPTPTFRSMSSAPPLCFFVSRAGRRLCPPPRGDCVSRPVASRSAFTLVASVPCGCSAPLGRLTASPVGPPQPPGLCFADVVALPLLFLFFSSACPWFRAAWPFVPPPMDPVWVCWVSSPCRSFSCPLLLRPFFVRAFGRGSCLVGFLFPPLARGLSCALCVARWAVPPPPAVAPGGVRCPASCCGLFCAARSVLLRRAVLLRGRPAVWFGVLLCCRLCRWLSSVGVGRAASVGGARCSAAPCCFVRILSCVVPSCVVMCCGDFSVAVWCRGCGLVLPLPSRFCALAGLRRLVMPRPPPPVCVSCLLSVCVAVLCWLVLCFVVLCCCLLRCVVRGAACRVVLCRFLLCFAGGVVLRCVSSCGCALLRASPCPVALCSVVVHCAVRLGALSWCSVLCCPAVCCCGLLCAVWCPSALCGWLCAVPCCCLLLCAVLRLWAWCLVALCCDVLTVTCCFVLVVLLCAVLCLLVLCWR